MSNFTSAQYQRVIDSFGAGRVKWISDLPGELAEFDKNYLLFHANVIKTTQGAFCLIEIEDDKLLVLWGLRKYSEKLNNVYGLKNAKPVHVYNKSNILTAHKFHYLFWLFKI